VFACQFIVNRKNELKQRKNTKAQKLKNFSTKTKKIKKYYTHYEKYSNERHSLWLMGFSFVADVNQEYKNTRDYCSNSK